MNENVFRRSLGIWLLAIGLLVYSYFQAIPGLHSLEPPQKLYKQGLVYRSQDSEDILSVKVLDIDLIPVKTDEAQYYLIKHDYGVTAMKTTFNTVYSMLKMKDRFPNQEIPLESGGFYLSVKVIPEVENRRKGGMKIHLRFEYADKKQDSILFRRQLLRLKDLVEYLNEEYNLGLKVDFRLLG